MNLTRRRVYRRGPVRVSVPRPIKSGLEFEAAFPVKGRILETLLCPDCEAEGYIRIRVAREKERVFVWCAGEVREFLRAGRRSARMVEAAGGLAAPMPGRVRRIVAKAGSSVARGDVILILEAMKMEHAIRAPRAGTVAKIFHAEGDLVEAGAVLAAIG